ncbi:uncharacterized protein LOC133878962 [Alnus glutinosa]|uniref:uncharacterized protein LOC133878961 n=1 Tax=Alnus glutinosa TaxID=3517 RepID=UPI002D7723FB|nr:uncharacterized protein LOC133878961 [Alnus glutinosa]XP_062173504.1 uncharacterized protein LOC133878962 [Alnus glutinosa]
MLIISNSTISPPSSASPLPTCEASTSNLVTCAPVTSPIEVVPVNSPSDCPSSPTDIASPSDCPTPTYIAIDIAAVEIAISAPSLPETDESLLTLPPVLFHSPFPHIVTRSKTGSLKSKEFPDYHLYYSTRHPLKAMTVTSLPSEPIHFAKACSDSNWMAAMESEYQALLDNKTWFLCPRPSNRNVIHNKWVFKLKQKPDGSIESITGPSNNLMFPMLFCMDISLKRSLWNSPKDLLTRINLMLYVVYKRLCMALSKLQEPSFIVSHKLSLTLVLLDL